MLFHVRELPIQGSPALFLQALRTGTQGYSGIQRSSLKRCFGVRPFSNKCYTRGQVVCLPLQRKKRNPMPTVKLTAQKFKDEIFDYTSGKDWNYKGAKPAIIDFYADWCGPCKMVAPILEALSDENPDIIIYKVDTQVEQELASVFQIRSIPSILFIPIGKQPMMQAGALPKHILEDVIQKELLSSVE
jgi:thioredoxin 1